MKFKLLEKKTLCFLIYIFPFILFFKNVIMNIYLTIFIIISITYIIKKKKFNLVTQDCLILFFFILVILSTLINKEIYEEYFLEILIKSILNLKYVLIFWILRNLIQENYINLNLFSKTSFFSILALSLDIFFQHLTGKSSLDFLSKIIVGKEFGFVPHMNYYNGFFRDEGIAGSHIQKFFLFSVIYFLSYKTNNIISNFFLFSIIYIFSIASLLSGQKIAFFILLITTIMLFFILNEKKNIFFSLFAVVITFFFLV